MTFPLFPPVQYSRSLREGGFERMEKSTRINVIMVWFHHNPLCMWINVGNCVFVRPELWAGEKEHKSGSVSAVWVQPWMNIPRVAKFPALACQILTSLFVWEPPNLYPTPKELGGRRGGVSQTRDDSGSWSVWVDVLMGPKATQQCHPHGAHSSLGEPCPVSGQLKERLEWECHCDGHGDKLLVPSPYPSASFVLLLSHIKP